VCVFCAASLIFSFLLSDIRCTVGPWEVAHDQGAGCDSLSSVESTSPLQSPLPSLFSPHTTGTSSTPTGTTLRDAFLTPTTDPATLSSMIQAYANAHPSLTPLTAVVQALFDAITISSSSSTTADTSLSLSLSPSTARGGTTLLLLRRFLDACSYLPPTVTHAGTSGPLSGPRALQMQIRKSSVWSPSPAPAATPTPTPTPTLIPTYAAALELGSDHID
jgi:hypothetical protein